MTFTFLTRRRRQPFAFALTLLLATGAVHAGAEDPRDTAAVQAVNLDDALFERMNHATHDMIPAMMDEDAVMVIDDDDGHPRRVSTLAAELDASPIASRILAKYHLDSRQYVLTFIALANGAMQAHGMPFTDAQGEHPPSHWGATPAQLAFCRAHLARIDAMFPKG